MITQKFRPIYFPIDGPDNGAMIIFRDVDRDELKSNFDKWCSIALAEIGESREREIMAIQHVRTEFVGLINALHCQTAALITDGSDRALEELLNNYFENYYKTIEPPEKIPLPSSFFGLFFQEITVESMKSILWFMMDIVTACKAKHGYNLALWQMLTLYERFSAVNDLGYDWHKALQKRDRTDKKAVKRKKKKKR
jgi:hypothetical protein